MKRSPTPFHLFAAAGSSSANTAASSSSLMSSRNSFGAGRRWGRGRRNFSYSSVGEDGDRPHQLVTGDSHFLQVHDANRGFRPSYNRGNSSRSQSSPSITPQPKYYNPRPQEPPFSGPYRPRPQSLPSQHQYISQNQQIIRQPSPHYGFNQQFRPQRQQQQRQQQFKPRPPKDLEYRNWEYAKPEPPPECERFTVLSYNILADYLAADHRQKLYFHVPNYMMNWDWRKRSLVFEIGLWSADILCLQEVDRFQDLKEELGLRGYSGIWKMRTGVPVDGCATFWRNSRFKLLHEESIEFNALGLRDNVAQICVFESLYQCNDSDAAAPAQCSRKAKRVVVCNIHVLFNPKRGEIKLGQARVLLSQAYAVSKLWDDAPIIVCGDFNSTPKSPLYNFIAEQKLDLAELPRDQISGQASAEIQAPGPSNPRPGALSADNFSQVPPTAAHIGMVNCDSPVPIQKQDYADESSENGTYGDTTLSSPPEVKEAVESCISMQCADEEVDKQLRERDIEIFEGGNGENKSYVSASHSDLEDTPVALLGEAACLGSPVKDVNNDSCSLNIKMESLSLNEIHEHKKEGDEKNTSLPDGTFPYQFSQSQESNSEVVESFKECPSSDNKSLYPPGIGPESPNDMDMVQPKYDPSAWTPAEIEAATGSSSCLVMEHPLKLQSVYREVEDCFGTRDPTGEPSATSYHRRFFGTVDYIWRTRGLQTSRVLAPIPKHAMQWTRGFPTKKWGSDHIALVSELAFSDTANPSSEVKIAG